MTATTHTSWRCARGARKATMTGWGHWVFLLLIPFSAFSADTWLNTERLRRDYELAELTREAKTLAETLDGLRAEEAGQMTMDRIDLEAPDLGLVAAQPGQIQVLQYAATAGESAPVSVEYAMAGNEELPAPAAEKEEKPWDTGSHTTRERTTSLAARLHEVIANVYASYLGAS